MIKGKCAKTCFWRLLLKPLHLNPYSVQTKSFLWCWNLKLLCVVTQHLPVGSDRIYFNHSTYLAWKLFCIRRLECGRIMYKISNLLFRHCLPKLCIYSVSLSWRSRKGPKSLINTYIVYTSPAGHKWTHKVLIPSWRC